MEDTGFGALRKLLDELRATGGTLDELAAISSVLSLLETCDALGDIDEHLQNLQEICRLASQDRTEAGLEYLGARTSYFLEISRLVSELGNLDELRKEMDLLEELKTQIRDKRASIRDQVRGLNVEELSRKLSVLRTLMERLGEWT